MEVKDLKLDQMVFTTKQVAHENAPIFHFIIDKDGDIYATGTDPMTNENTMLISLGQLLKIDPSLKRITNLDLNTKLFRPTREAQWSILN